MQALDAKLLDQLAAVRTEITQVEQAQPSADTIVAARLAEVEAAAARFQAAPFDIYSGDIRATSPAQVRNLVLGAMATLLPDATRALIEAHTREVEQRRQVLRLAPEAKAAKLAALHDKARQLEARVELQRRTLEQDPDTTFARVGSDPGVWLADDADLRAMAATANGRSR